MECSSCHREYEYVRAQGHTLTRCNTCLVNDRRFQRKLDIIEYLGGKCNKCGYNKCPIALDFHHIEPKHKTFNISGSHTRSWFRIMEELKKGIILCSNCHRETEFEGTRFAKFIATDIPSLL